MRDEHELIVGITNEGGARNKRTSGATLLCKLFLRSYVNATTTLFTRDDVIIESVQQQRGGRIMLNGRSYSRSPSFISERTN